MLQEPPTNDKLHVEVMSTSSRMGLLHPKVCTLHLASNCLDIIKIVPHPIQQLNLNKVIIILVYIEIPKQIYSFFFII